VAALPLIISQLRQEGYDFATVPELLHLDRSGPIQTARQTPPLTDLLIKKL